MNYGRYGITFRVDFAQNWKDIFAFPLAPHPSYLVAPNRYTMALWILTGNRSLIEEVSGRHKTWVDANRRLKGHKCI